MGLAESSESLHLKPRSERIFTQSPSKSHRAVLALAWIYFVDRLGSKLMNISDLSLVRRTLLATTFEQLRTLLQHTISIDSPRSWEGQECGSIDSQTFLFTETSFRTKRSRKPLPLRFVLAVSSKFSALLVGESCPEDPTNRMYVGLTFDPKEIAAFLQPDNSLWGNKPLAEDLRAKILATLQPNDPIVASEFALQLAEVLTEGNNQAGMGVDCQPVVEKALSLHVEQERLLERVTAQTRECVELPTLISSIIDRLQRFLDLDRLAVYQFDRLAWDSASDKNTAPGRNCMTYEARISDEIPSLLSSNTDDEWHFLSQHRDRYEKGKSLVLNDVAKARSLSAVYRRQLRNARVRSQLVVPIQVRNLLWGLLVAHQCDRVRTWQPRECEFLEHIAEHLGVAVHQAQLYSELQQQKQTLEQRVSNRTRDLRAALAAAQAASQTRTEFLATVSHELRTPLTCIIGMSATLLRWSFGHLTPKQREYIQTIYNSGEHLMVLINDLLDLSKIESGKMVLEISDFSLTQLARQMFQMTIDRAAVNGVRLELDLCLNTNGDRFRADRNRVSQILFNLLSNAIKFTATGGQAVLRIYRKAGYAIFEVEDTGIGIPKEQQSLLFETFRQLESTYTRKYGGTGLGLALTKQLVELHGGSIEVESQVGVGSKFIVRLPSQPEVLKPPPPPEADRSNSRVADSASAAPQGHIVLIADCEEEATSICDLLTTAGYHAIWMLEGSTALETIELLNPVQPECMPNDLAPESRHAIAENPLDDGERNP